MDRRSFLVSLGGGTAAFTSGFATLSLVGCGDGRESGAVDPFLVATREEMAEWFREARFGMFIHWGVYSLLGKGEWVMNNDCMTSAAYEELPPRFDPTLFDPSLWVSTAKAAGMRYITITSKHHDGFAMWHSKVSPYNIVDATPYGRDVLKMLADECARQEMRLFFYHSHLDWRHPDYFPRGKTGSCSGRPDAGDFNAYLDYMDAQVAELLSGEYGQLGGIWFDGWWDHHITEHDKSDTRTGVDWRLDQTYQMIHRRQPTALIGNNHHVDPFPGEDFQVVERDLPGQNTFGHNTTAVSDLPLETCDTMNGSWGYHAQDDRWKSTEELVHYLVRAAGHDANLLLNVGPTPEGTFQPEVFEGLAGVGEWNAHYGETIYGTRGGPMPPQDWGVMTRRGDVAFLHVLDPAAPVSLTLPGTENLRPISARVFGSEEDLNVVSQPDIGIDLPPERRQAVDTIVEIEVSAE